MRQRSKKKQKQYQKRSSPKQARKPTSHKTYVGKVDKNAKGFAFLICKDRKVPDAFVPRNEARSLLTGDTVEYIMVKDGGRPAAQIKKIIERGQTRVLVYLKQQGKHFYGSTSDGEVYDVKPFKGLRPDQFLLGTILDYPSEKRRGSLEVFKILGAHLLPKHDYLIAAAKFALREEFPPQVHEEANAKRVLVDDVLQREPDRKDHRKKPFITIDGEDAKDFDDAVLVETASPSGSAKSAAFVLYVAIADVSHYVRPKGALDKEALARSTSVYFPGFCLPMLPEELSNDLCSLRPKEDKLTLTAEIHLDAKGSVVGQKFYKSAICTAARTTYTEVHAYFAKDPATLKKYAALAGPLTSALSLYQLLLKKRAERGVMDFELPECKIEIDADGKPISAKHTERFESHRLIEEFMVLANSVVAKALREGEVPALYRVHETPDPKSLEDINLLLENLGVSESMENLTPREFSRILKATAKLKISHTLHQAILRMQRQARYEPIPKGHFGLALEDYCHFTSPIRRYPDLVVHRALKRLIQGREKADKTDKAKEPLDIFVQLGSDTSDRERKAMLAERFAVKRKQCWFLRQRLGEVFPATVAGVTQNGLFLEITEFGIEGFLPVDSLTGQWDYDEHRQCLVRRASKQVIALGDTMTIQIAQVSITDNEITFAEYQ